MEWRGFVFLCCVEGVEGTLVFYNWKIRNSFARWLRCVLRFVGFSRVCWGYVDSNCWVPDACWCLDPVGLCAGGAHWVYKQTISTVGGATWWAGALAHCLCFSSGESICFFILFCVLLIV